MFVSLLLHDTTYSDFLSDNNAVPCMITENLKCLSSINVRRYLVTVITCTIFAHSIHKTVAYVYTHRLVVLPNV
jgi:hypothetical protein